MIMLGYGTKKKIHSALCALLFVTLLIALLSPELLLSRISGGLALISWLVRQWLWSSMNKHYLGAKLDHPGDSEYVFNWVIASWLLGLSTVFVPAFFVVLETVPANYDFAKFRLGILAFIAGHSVVVFRRYQQEKRAEERRKKELQKRRQAFLDSEKFHERGK